MTSIAYMYPLSPRALESAVHRPVSVHSAGSRSAITPHSGYLRPQSTDFSGLSRSPTRSPMEFKELSSSAVGNNNNATIHGQTVDLTAAKFTTRMAGGSVPRLDGPQKSRRSSKGHMHDNTSAARPPSTIASPTTACTGDDDDLISSQHIGVSQILLGEAVVVVAAVVARTVQYLWPFWQ